MNRTGIRKATTAARDVSSFIVPRKLKKLTASAKDVSVFALIPTYKPQAVTLKLINDLVKLPNVHVLIVDDSTPHSAKTSMSVLQQVQRLGDKKITVLRTPTKQLKASALNFGLYYIFSLKKQPDYIITLDDDVVIRPDTISEMVKVLTADPEIGAVCSVAWVLNKHKNVLTRLQALEYHSFTITKLSDNGFLYGPLVMQGMLAAFRSEAIKAVNGFDAEKLIEDYDITVRIKNAGWKTAIAPNAVAWTHVPETLGDLWRQRIRWSYGGLIVIRDFWKQVRSVFQDLIGHSLFISLFTLVILSLIFTQHTETPPLLVFALIIIALIQFALTFTFNVLSLLAYSDRDKLDWVMKLAIFPEFVYSNILTAILLGSYLFFLYNVASRVLVKYLPILEGAHIKGLKSFKKIGYSGTWGTRG